MGTAGQPVYAPSPHSRFTVGRDRSGHWVVCDVEGLVGGLFTDRSSAIHFAMFESDYEPGAVFCAPDDSVLAPSSIFDPPPNDRRRIAPFR